MMMPTLPDASRVAYANVDGVRVGIPFQLQDDEALIAAVATGEHAALEVLYGRYAALVLHQARRSVQDTAQAEDIVQEVFWNVWQRSRGFNHARGSFRSWLLVMTRNQCIDELRRRRSRPLYAQTIGDWSPLDCLADDSDVAWQVWQELRRHELGALIGQLPPEQRHVIELAYYAEMTHAEIAELTHRPLGTIKSQLRLGLQKLKRALADDPGDEALSCE